MFECSGVQEHRSHYIAREAKGLSSQLRLTKFIILSVSSTWTEEVSARCHRAHAAAEWRQTAYWVMGGCSDFVNEGPYNLMTLHQVP